MKILVIIILFLLISPGFSLAYGSDSSSSAAPGLNLPEIRPDIFFNLLQNITNYLSNTFGSGQLPNISNLTPQPNLKSLNLSPSGGVLNQVIGIITKIIQIFINLVTLFIKQIFLLVPQQQK